jgi:cytochrome c oxidase cbb3-type subunit 2
MKGLQPIFLGIFGIFAFSWLGLTVVPNLQIGSLNPQSDEEGTDIYPMPPSGMALRGARVYAANGCAYCHTQQVRPEYGGADLERKWGERRSAPRDYIFEPVVMLGKMRTGPDLANVGHRPALQEKEAAGAPSPTAGASTETSPTAGVPPTTAEASPAAAAASPAAAPASPAGTPALAATTAPAIASPAPEVAPGAPATLPPAGNGPAASIPTSASTMVADVTGLTATGQPLPYSAAWHHRHLYNPRSISEDSNMPAYRFLYEKRRIGGKVSPEALNFAAGKEELETGWEIVPSYDAKCLVAYLMSRNQSHPLKEAKSPVIAAPAASPAAEAKK